MQGVIWSVLICIYSRGETAFIIGIILVQSNSVTGLTLSVNREYLLTGVVYLPTISNIGKANRWMCRW